MSNKQKKVLFWVIVGLGLVLVGFSIYRINRLGEEKGNGVNMIGEITNEERAQNEEGREEDKEEFEVLEEDDREEIDISDWMTYRNEEYGFEVRYPEGWEVTRLISTKEDLNTYMYFPIASINFASFQNIKEHIPIGLNENEIYINIDILRNPYNNSLNNFIYWYDNLFSNETIIIDDSKFITVDGIKSIQQIRKYITKETEYGEAETIYIPNLKNQVIRVSFSNVDIYKAKQNFDPIIKLFLNNFKIL